MLILGKEKGASSHIIMIIPIKEVAREKYIRHRSSYIQSIILFCLMMAVLAAAALVWLFKSEDAPFTPTLCASYLFVTLNFIMLIGRNCFIYATSILAAGFGLRPMSRDAASMIFLIIAMDSLISVVVCTVLTVLGIEIGVFGTIHIFISYVPMALLSLVILPNRLYSLVRRRDRMRSFKRYIS